MIWKKPMKTKKTIQGELFYHYHIWYLIHLTKKIQSDVTV